MTVKQEPTPVELTKVRHKTWFQFILFTAMSLITTLIDLGTFALLNYWLLTSYRNHPFVYGPFNYTPINGGLTAFLAFAISFIVSQTTNFFLQRKVTFGASNNIFLSGLLYIAMVVTVLFVQLYVPTLIHQPLANITGDAWADFIIKNLNMTISFLIQFPISKYIIMRAGQNKTLPLNS